MNLIKIEAKGFKSFANLISLSFDGGVVGIVGPNGSGKSNINDAIRWVLGERSLKSLRGSSSDDVIFSGSKTVPAADIAEVTLTFENSAQRIPIPGVTFTITRRVERGSGNSAYYINGAEARLRDVEEIALEMNVSKSSLAIISQGTVQNIAQANPLERRVIFEEVAGTAKYKNRKEEALRKLEKTSESLEQLKAVVTELEKQLGPLRRQADKAQRFLEKKSALKEVEVGLLVENLRFFKEKLDTLSRELSSELMARDEMTTKINSIEQEYQEKTDLKLKLETDFSNLSTRLQILEEKERQIELAAIQVNQRRQMIIDGQISVSSASRLKAMKEELENLSQQTLQHSAWHEKFQNEIKTKSESVIKEQDELSRLWQNVDQLRRQVMHVKTRIMILREQAESKSHLSKGVKTVLENKSALGGIAGLVSDLLRVPPRFAIAIEAVLGNSLSYIVVNDSSTAVQAVNFLRNNRGGFASFVPLNTIRPRGIIDDHINVLKMQHGYIGVAAELIETEPRFEIMKKFFLGNIIIVETIEDANAVSQLMHGQYMVVSLEGDTVRPGGIVTGGDRTRHGTLLGGTDQITELEASLPAIENELSIKEQEHRAHSASVTEGQAVLADLKVEAAQVREKFNVVQGMFVTLKAKYESETNEKVELATATQSDEAAIMAEISTIRTTLRGKQESITSLNKTLNRIVLEKSELEKSLRTLTEANATKLADRSKAEFVLRNSQDRLASEYQMTFEHAASSYSLKLPYEEAEKIVNQLQQEIKELGFVNIDALKDYEEVNARREKLRASEEELTQAREIILSAIAEMDHAIITKIDETVKAVNGEIGTIFRKMFGGGNAEIKYSDPENLLETGIEVIAQPPGKTVRNLNLFSGGEKSMIAISLLFAILKTKPIPLCILDEVEAALDESNVIRFAQYLQELKLQTQFVVITHRIGTMTLVDSLFGATMQTKGVTTFFTVKLEDAKRLITT